MHLPTLRPHVRLVTHAFGSRLVLYGLLIASAPTLARAQPVEVNLTRAEAILIPECSFGHADACEELIKQVQAWVRDNPNPRHRWQYGRLLLPSCAQGYEPACRAMVKIGWGMEAGDPVSRDRGARLIAAACEAGSPFACEEALDLGVQWTQVGKSSNYQQGIQILETACLAGEPGGCEQLWDLGEGDPFGEPVRTLGNILSYAGTGLAIAASAAWAGAFMEGRCGTRAQSFERQLDSNTLYTLCTLGAIGYAAGTATSIVGTKLFLNGQARFVARSEAVSGSSLFFWFGAALAVAGGLVPLTIEAMGREWWEPMAWSPLILGTAGQGLLVLSKWLTPRIYDQLDYRVWPAAFTDGQGGAGAGVMLGGALR